MKILSTMWRFLQPRFGREWVASPESLALAHEVYLISGCSWDRVKRSAVRRDGVWVVDRQKLKALTARELSSQEI